MIKIKLTDIILEYQNGESDIILQILDRFQFTIKKLSNKLNYECAETDLIIYLIELINKININNFVNKSEGSIVNYIYISLLNKSKYLYKSNLKFNNETIEFNDDIKSIGTYLEVYNIELYSLLNCLNDMQKKIIIDKYINKLTNIEIASSLGISRQSVYNNNLKSLNILKKSFLNLQNP